MVGHAALNRRIGVRVPASQPSFSQYNPHHTRSGRLGTRSKKQEEPRVHLERQTMQPSSLSGWRSVFGKARREDVAQVDAIFAEELEQVDPDDWQ